MKTIKIDPSKCPQDHVCPLIKICPVGAIDQQGFSAPQINHEKCLTCGKCVASCLHQALSLEEKI